MPRARGLDAPAGVLATAAPDRSRTRRSFVALAVARGSIESSSLLGRAARRALGKHSVCLCGDTGSGCVCRGPRVMLPSPSSWASAGSEFEGHRERREFLLSPKYSGCVDVVRSGRRGDLDCGASARTALSVPQFPHLKRNTQGLRGDPRAPEVCLLSSCPLRLLSPLLRPAGPARSGAGLEARASDVEVKTARLNWRRNQKGLGDTNAHPSFRPSPLLFVLSGDSPPPK